MLHAQKNIVVSLSLLLVATLASIDASAVSETADQVAKMSQNEKSVAETPAGVVRLDETVISGNQELPKVLYILPWRDPNGLPEIELDASYSEMDVFRRLYPPAYRRELTYFESLETNSPDSETR